MPAKATLLAQLQEEIHSLQGYKPACAPQNDVGLGRLVHSFPASVFPFAALHEFLCCSPEDLTTSAAFLASLLSPLLNKGGAALWIGGSHTVFPPALKTFGVRPDQIIFANAKREKDVVWAVEEATKCNAVAAVVGEITELGFTESRRLQLAIEQSGVGCFLLRKKPRNCSTASTAHWHIKSLPSRLNDGMPGVGYPRWQVNLLKVRNGKPATWEVEWVRGGFRYVSKRTVVPEDRQRKAS